MILDLACPILWVALTEITVEAIEHNGYKIEWPLGMGTKLVPLLQRIHDLDEGEHEEILKKQYDRSYRKLDRQKTKEIKALIKVRSKRMKQKTSESR